jgi:hypothetical protein
MTKTEFLSASLPYGLKVKKTVFGIYELIGKNNSGTYLVNYNDWVNDSKIIPVIHPLSDLTKPCVQADYNDGNPFVPIKIMLNEIIESWAEVGLNYPNDETGLYKDIVSNINYCEYWIIKLLLKWHFDLITEDCEKVYVTEEFNPYK